MKLKRKQVTKKVTVPVRKSKPAKSSGPDIHKNTHRMRSRLDGEGVAMLTSGSWVCPTFDLTAAEALVGTPPPKTSNWVYLFIRSKHGMVARPAITDDRGKLFNIGGKVFSEEVLPDAAFTIVPVGKLARFCTSAATGVEVNFRASKREVTGLLFGGIESSCAALLVKKGKTFEFLDVETKSNVHNKDKVVSFTKTGLPLKPLIQQTLPANA